MTSAAPQPLRIDFVSDVMCPWCVIGMKALEQALANCSDVVTPEWHCQPFELNPAMPPEGENSQEHIARKYGAAAAANPQARNTIREMGAALGFAFKGGADARIWNSHDCHRLLHWAGKVGTDAAKRLKMALFEAHFSRGEAMNDHQVLVAAAIAAGLDGAAAAEVLASGRYSEEVLAAEAFWRDGQDVHAVPAIIFNGKYAIMGGQPAAVFEKVIRRIAAGEV
jgi:predicted DsbA family dithiol-disulfide isomerase